MHAHRHGWVVLMLGCGFTAEPGKFADGGFGAAEDAGLAVDARAGHSRDAGAGMGGAGGNGGADFGAEPGDAGAALDGALALDMAGPDLAPPPPLDANVRDPDAVGFDAEALDFQVFDGAVFDGAVFDARRPDAAPADMEPDDMAPDAAPPVPDAAPPVPDAVPPVPDAAPPVPDMGPVCGDGVPEAPEQCDDGELGAIDWCDDRCAPSYPCAPLDGVCGAASDPGSREGVLARLNGCHFGLRLQDDRAAAGAVMDRVAAAAGGYVELSDVLRDLNREGQRGITAGAADRLRNHDWVGFRWNDGDQGVDYWMPQGMTGHSDAQAGPRADRRRLALVSWYHRTEARPTKGARISLVDMTNLDAVRYRHLLLVEPVERGGTATFASAEYDGGDALHAGGIVWWGDWLYVADTAQGFRIFDMSRIVRIEDTDDRDRIGASGGRVDAHGYRYIVPQVARYRRADDACRINFSYVSLDRSSDPPTLLSGEYARDDVDGRMVHWRLDPRTGLLEERGGEIRGTEGKVAGQTRVQGALRWRGDYYLSSSSQVGRLGRLYRNRPGEASRITAWPYGCEDLYYERDTDLVWTPTEHPDAREVVGIPLVRP